VPSREAITIATYLSLPCNALQRGLVIAILHVVRLSVHPSVTFVDCDHIGWNSRKIILWLISEGFLLSADPNIMCLLQREHPENGRINVFGKFAANHNFPDFSLTNVKSPTFPRFQVGGQSTLWDPFQPRPICLFVAKANVGQIKRGQRSDVPHSHCSKQIMLAVILNVFCVLFRAHHTVIFTIVQLSCFWTWKRVPKHYQWCSCSWGCR